MTVRLIEIIVNHGAVLFRSYKR